MSAQGISAPATGNEPAPKEQASTVVTVAGAWQRIKDHKVIQWGVAYFAAALALAHAYEIGAHTYHWSPVVGQVLVGTLAIGFFVAIVLAWYHGHRGLTSFTRAELSILAALLLVGAGMLYVFVQPAEHGEPSARHESALPAAKPMGISLAVLPFTNLSSDKEQEFFSDGMTEEIISALAKVPNWRVVGRTSTFQFKNANKDLRAIGKALGANHLIEGAVRKAGNKVRIDARLIRADDGTNLWSERYDRDLKDVFAVQEEIATAIADALEVPLGLKTGQRLVANRTADTGSYQTYLKARALVNGRGASEPGGPLTQAIQLLDQVVAKDPDYAPAWGLLGQAHALLPVFTAAFLNGSRPEIDRITARAIQLGEAAAKRAIALDENNVDAIVALGQLQRLRGRLIEAERLFSRALDIDEGDPAALNQYGLTVGLTGRLSEAVSLRRRLQAQEPLVPAFNRTTAVVLWANKQAPEALAILEAAPRTPTSHILLAKIYASAGRFAEAAGSLKQIPPGLFAAGTIQEAATLLGSAPAIVPSARSDVSRGQLGFVYLHVGHPDRALDSYAIAADAHALNGTTMALNIWAPSYAPARRTKAFNQLAHKMGLVDYWREKGWPPFCKPTTGDDFACH